MQHGHSDQGLDLYNSPGHCQHPAGCLLCPQVSPKWITSRQQHSVLRALVVLAGEWPGAGQLSLAMTLPHICQ